MSETGKSRAEGGEPAPGDVVVDLSGMPSMLGDTRIESQLRILNDNQAAAESRIRALEEWVAGLKRVTYAPAAAPARTRTEAEQAVLDVWEAMGELTSYVVDGHHHVRADDVCRVFERHVELARRGVKP
jgi:hypothetical protein